VVVVVVVGVVVVVVVVAVMVVVVVVVVAAVAVVVVVAATTYAVVNAQFCRCARHEDSGASGSMDSLFVKVGTSWVQYSASRLTHFTLRTETQEARNIGPDSRTGRFREKILASAGNRNTIHQTPGPQAFHYTDWSIPALSIW